VATYDIKDVIVTVGADTMFGFSPDSKITLTPTGPDFEEHQGCDGKWDRSQNPEAGYTLEISLSQTSPCNEVLSTYSQIDRKSGLGVLPVVVKYLGGKTINACLDGYIKTRPTETYNSTIGANVWTIFMPPSGEQFLGAAVKS